jgi:hypothetical protein
LGQAHQLAHLDDLALGEDEFSNESLGRQPFQIALRELTFGEWRPRLARGSDVLDIGCADETSTFDIASPGITMPAVRGDLGLHHFDRPHCVASPGAGVAQEGVEGAIDLGLEAVDPRHGPCVRAPGLPPDHELGDRASARFPLGASCRRPAARAQG